MTSGLEIFWYIIIIASIICYAMLDGFDLGVGALHLFARDDQERRVFLNAIGPVWDGNEVWLVVLIGALFAGFPVAYATLFSAFYTPLIILICGLIFRAVAIEFRSKLSSTIWRGFWDTCFFLGSVLIAVMIGAILGNLVTGIPLDEHKDMIGNFLVFLRPYPLLVGLTTLALFMMHGAIYLVMKTEGNLHDQLREWINPAIIFFLMCYATTTMVTLIYQPHMTSRIRERPYLFLVVLLNMLAIANIPREISRKKDGFAFISSSISIACLLSLFALGIFPTLIRSSINPDEFSVTVANAAASPKTLMILAIIVAIGIPLVIAYGICIYRIFRGKVKLDHMSY